MHHDLTQRTLTYSAHTPIMRTFKHSAHTQTTYKKQEKKKTLPNMCIQYAPPQKNKYTMPY